VISGYEEAPIDCARQECALRTEAYADPLAIADAPIRFDDSLPVPPPYPVIEVDPATGLQEGAAVTVKGRGFAPAAPVGIAQCRSAPASENDCDPAAVTLTTDAAGEFTADIDVRRVITTAGGARIDCGASAGRCLIGAANLDDVFGEYALSPGLRFGPAPPPAGPPPAGPPPAATPTGHPTTVLGSSFDRGGAGGALARTGTGIMLQVLASLAFVAVGLLMIVVAKLRALALRSLPLRRS
jgi:hypothetical protein